MIHWCLIFAIRPYLGYFEAHSFLKSIQYFLPKTKPTLNTNPKNKYTTRINAFLGADFSFGMVTGFNTVNNGVSFLTCKSCVSNCFANSEYTVKARS